MQMDERRMEFVRAADELFAERGIGCTSVGDICERVGVTRSLFYHYFKNKWDVTDAVIDQKTLELVSKLRTWTQQVEAIGVREALREFAGLIRGHLCQPSSFGGSIMREANAELIQRFAMRSASVLAKQFVENAGKEGAFINRCHVRHPYDSFYILCLGIITPLMMGYTATDEQLADVMMDMLHIES